MKKCDYLIIGGGIVGLACAYELRRRYPAASIIILEKEKALGLHASGRNSGVLHSGIYYKPDSLKAGVCAQGAKRMRSFAKENNLPLLENGKLIVAGCQEDLPRLDQLMRNAFANGVSAELLDEAGARAIEPHARVYKKAIFVRDTAAVDSLSVVRCLAGILMDRGVEIETASKVLTIDAPKKVIGTVRENFSYGFLINAAGAFADKIARHFGAGGEYALVPFKGFYYKLRPDRAHLVCSNIYPVPHEGFPFLGIHLTRHPSGEVYAGPTAVPVFGRENYRAFSGVKLKETSEILGCLLKMYFSKDASFRALVHEEMAYYYKPFFLRQAQGLVPALKADDLISCAKAGIRPQLIDRQSGRLEMDYVVKEAESSVHVLNAVSPAFTSAFSFAEVIADKISQLTHIKTLP